jgi:hypothetical protein
VRLWVTLSSEDDRDVVVGHKSLAMSANTYLALEGEGGGRGKMQMGGRLVGDDAARLERVTMLHV